MKIVAIIFFLLAVVLGVAALNKLNMDGKEGAQAAGYLFGLLMFPALFGVVGIVLWKKASKAAEMM